MVILTIKNEDGSTYWVERFKNQDTCDVWYAREQTRPYWNNTRFSEIEVRLPTTPDQAHKDSSAALAYLDATDWLIVRQVETGELCPDDIKQLRAAARLKVIR